MIEAITVARLRAAYGEGVSDTSDADLREMLDGLVSEMESTLGHGFGRVAWASATEAASLVIDADSLTFGSDEYTFAAYPTVGALQAAVNGAGEAYTIELAAFARYDTPSTLLQALSTTVGPTYANRASLGLSGFYFRGSGKATSHLFLPLPVAAVTSVTEDGEALASTAYWVQGGQPWLVRKACACADVAACRHIPGRWLATYPDNVVVVYKPTAWLSLPRFVGQVLVDAFGAQTGVSGDNLSSESFLGYSYSRQAAPAMRANEILSSARLRPFAVQADFYL